MVKERILKTRIIELNIDGDSIEEVIEELKKYVGMNATCDLDYDFDNCYGGTNIVYKELETDREYEDRLKSIKQSEEEKAKQKTIEEAKEKEMYEKLKKKYE